MVDPSPSHRALARASLLAFIHETQRSDYEPLSIDTQAGEKLFILSLCYDWTYDQWSQEEQNGIGEWLWNVADICWSHLGNERQDYGQAHYLGCALGLLAFSFLFWEDHPRARGWVAHCRGVLDLLLTMLPQDGFYPHGINLWIYEHGFLLRWLELFRACAGEDLWRTTDSSEDLAFDRHPPSLVVVEQNPFLPELLPEYPVLRPVVPDCLPLLAVDPTGEDCEQQLPWLQLGLHVPPDER